MTSKSATSGSAKRKPVALDALRGEREFRKVRAHGRVVRGRSFTLRVTDYRPRYGERWYPRAMIGIVASKKSVGNAVKRNRARRRAREALRTMGDLPACRAVLHLNPSALSMPFAEFQAELRRALSVPVPARKKQGGRGRTGASQTPAPTPVDRGNPEAPEHVREERDSS